MIDFKDLVPIGSVVKLKDEIKKLVVVGILQQDEESGEFYDYIGVLYPEGNIEQYMFNHDMIENVVFRGYEDGERITFIQSLEIETAREEADAEELVNNVLLHLYETKDSDNCALYNVEALVSRFESDKDAVKQAVEFLIDNEYVTTKKASKGKLRITQKGLDIFSAEAE